MCEYWSNSVFDPSKFKATAFEPRRPARLTRNSYNFVHGSVPLISVAMSKFTTILHCGTSIPLENKSVETRILCVALNSFSELVRSNKSISPWTINARWLPRSMCSQTCCAVFLVCKKQIHKFWTFFLLLWIGTFQWITYGAKNNQFCIWHWFNQFANNIDDVQFCRIIWTFHIVVGYSLWQYLVVSYELHVSSILRIEISRGYINLLAFGLDELVHKFWCRCDVCIVKNDHIQVCWIENPKQI